MTANSDDKFGDRLRLIRLRLKLSQEKMAKKLSITQHTYSNYENNKSYPSVEIVEKLIQFPGVDLNWLIFGENTSLSFVEFSDPLLADFLSWLKKVPIVRHTALAALEDCKFKYPELFKDKKTKEDKSEEKK